MNRGLAAWHRFMASGDPGLLADLLADEAVFHSPVVHTPQEGRDKVTQYLIAAGEVFGADSGFRYLRELVDGPEVCLEFAADIEGVAINGIDLIRFDLEGRIVDFKVMVRPLKAIDLVRAKMAVRLEAGAS